MNQTKLKHLREIARLATDVAWSASARHRELNFQALANYVNKNVDTDVPGALTFTDVGQLDCTWDEIDLDENGYELIINDVTYYGEFSVGFLKDAQTYGVIALKVMVRESKTSPDSVCSDPLVCDYIREQINEKVSWNINKYEARY